MDPYVITLGAAVAGGVARTVIPYLLKVYEDKDLKFDVSYFYSLCGTTIASVIALVPQTVASVDAQQLVTIFLAAAGVNDLVNRGVTAVKSR